MPPRPQLMDGECSMPAAEPLRSSPYRVEHGHLIDIKKWQNMWICMYHVSLSIIGRDAFLFLIIQVIFIFPIWKLQVITQTIIADMTGLTVTYKGLGPTAHCSLL